MMAKCDAAENDYTHDNTQTAHSTLDRGILGAEAVEDD